VSLSEQDKVFVITLETLVRTTHSIRVPGEMPVDSPDFDHVDYAIDVAEAEVQKHLTYSHETRKASASLVHAAVEDVFDADSSDSLSTEFGFEPNNFPLAAGTHVTIH